MYIVVSAGKRMLEMNACLHASGGGGIVDLPAFLRGLLFGFEL
jgi:hypothetical protein